VIESKSHVQSTFRLEEAEGLTLSTGGLPAHALTSSST
jgi:hypothetical protein